MGLGLGSSGRFERRTDFPGQALSAPDSPEYRIGPVNRQHPLPRSVGTPDRTGPAWPMNHNYGFQSWHLVRVGLLGNVGRFRSLDGVSYGRGTRVLCRTLRGLEVGEVLSHSSRWTVPGEPDGSLIRALTVEDELAYARLYKNRDAAYQACNELLAARRVSTVLVEVEPLFDGSALYFYFLGSISTEVQTLVDELAVTYESKVRFAEFVAAVEQGCGPDCGTENAAGCGSSCASCAVANVCRSS